MKVAVILTGFCRKYEETHQSMYLHLFKKYNADIFISSWDVVQYRPENWDSNNPKLNYELPTYKLDTESIINLYNKDGKLVSYNFENWNNFVNNRFSNLDLSNNQTIIHNVRAKKHGSFWVERLRDQWYIVKKGWDLIQNPSDYDIILKVRFDLLLNKIELNPNQFTIPLLDIVDRVGINYCDYLAYGNYEQMKKYMSLFDNIEDISSNHNVDITNAEEMLYFYMEKYKNPINKNIDYNINYELLR